MCASSCGKWDISSCGAFWESQSLIARSWLSLFQLTEVRFRKNFWTKYIFGGCSSTWCPQYSLSLACQTRRSFAGCSFLFFCSHAIIIMPKSFFRLLNCILCTCVVSYSLFQWTVITVRWSSSSGCKFHHLGNIIEWNQKRMKMFKRQH